MKEKYPTGCKQTLFTPRAVMCNSSTFIVVGSVSANDTMTIVYFTGTCNANSVDTFDRQAAFYAVSLASMLTSQVLIKEFTINSLDRTVNWSE